MHICSGVGRLMVCIAAKLSIDSTEMFLLPRLATAACSCDMEHTRIRRIMAVMMP